jgi:hypothetical protein
MDIFGIFSIFCRDSNAPLKIDKNRHNSTKIDIHSKFSRMRRDAAKTAGRPISGPVPDIGFAG